MEPWVQLIRDVGFPAAVAILVLWRLDAKLEGVRLELVVIRKLLGERRGGYRDSDPPGDR